MDQEKVEFNDVAKDKNIKQNGTKENVKNNYISVSAWIFTYRYISDILRIYKSAYWIV